MKGARYFLRNFTATAVREHLRSQIEESGGSPELTKNEVELVRFVCEGSFDWRAFSPRNGEASRRPRSLRAVVARLLARPGYLLARWNRGRLRVRPGIL